MSDVLPKKLPGVVCAQLVRCGKKGCRCQRGDLHGPYYYRFWWESGRLRKEYIQRSRVQLIRECCDRRRTEQREARDSRQNARELSELLRQIERSI